MTGKINGISPPFERKSYLLRFKMKTHSYQTLFASEGNLQIPSVQTTSYGKNAFVYMVIRTCNDIQKEMKGVMLNTFSLIKLQWTLSNSTPPNSNKSTVTVKKP